MALCLFSQQFLNSYNAGAERAQRKLLLLVNLLRWCTGTWALHCRKVRHHVLIIRSGAQLVATVYSLEAVSLWMPLFWKSLLIDLIYVVPVSALSVYRGQQEDNLDGYLQSGSDGAKVQLFPNNQDPPEETLEFWMHSGMQGTPESALVDRVNCLMSSARNIGQKISLFKALICTKYRKCESDLSHLVDVCLMGQCEAMCRLSADPDTCLDVCMEQGISTGHAPEHARRGSQADDEVRRVPSKRYRLGLYDCISSYCSSLQGEDRKSCIVYYCHRSSTAQWGQTSQGSPLWPEGSSPWILTIKGHLDLQTRWRSSCLICIFWESYLKQGSINNQALY